MEQLGPEHLKSSWKQTSKMLLWDRLDTDILDSWEKLRFYSLSFSALGDTMDIRHFVVIWFIVAFHSCLLNGTEFSSFVTAEQEGTFHTVEPSQSIISYQRAIWGTLGLRDGISQTAVSLGTALFPLSLVRLFISKEMGTDSD